MHFATDFTWSDTAEFPLTVSARHFGNEGHFEGQDSWSYQKRLTDRKSC
jgi:hypothetical protein